MAQRVSFDAEDLIRQMREASEVSLALARATVTDPASMAFIEAQMRLQPAMECAVREHIALREGGFDQYFIAALYGVLAGRLLAEVHMNHDDSDGIILAFNQQMHRTFRGENMIGGRKLTTHAKRAGRA